MPKKPRRFKKAALNQIANMENMDKVQRAYPTKPNRYALLSYNRNSQACYTDEEIKLLNKIKQAYKALVGDEKAEHVFASEKQLSWYNFWECVIPKTVPPVDSDSFTLPSREVKDERNYPLWTYADNMARLIANWQSERVRRQDPKLMNDPIMLVFSMLGNEFYSNIAMSECRSESVEYLNKLRTFVKNIMYWAPNFGPDRSQLHFIQESLGDASQRVENCIAHRQLPLLLSDTIDSGKSVEENILNHLHFLVDQPVKPNFSKDYLSDTTCNSSDSPLCTIFSRANSEGNEINRFYQVETITNADGSQQLNFKIKENLLEGINFPNAFDKKSYLETLAILESLSTVRKTVKRFQSVQEKLGNYVFALRFLDDAKELATNYINLINRAQQLVSKMMTSADSGLKEILKIEQNRQSDFEINLRHLETGAVKNAKLEQYSKNAITRITQWQNSMVHLVAIINSGEAANEVQLEVQSLAKDIHFLNQFLPELINEKEMAIIKQFTTDNEKCQLPQGQSAEMDETFGLSYSDEMRRCPIKKVPIYTRRVYSDATHKEEIGSISYYGKKGLCIDENNEFNVVGKTGIFNELPLEEVFATDKTCDVTKPNFPEKAMHYAKLGFAYGAMSAGSHVIAEIARKKIKTSPKATEILRNLSYYGFLFTYNFFKHQNQLSQNDEYVPVSTLFAAAFWDTVPLCVFNTFVNYISDLISSYYPSEKTSMLPKVMGVASKLGFFGYQVYNNGVIEATATTAAAMITENAINYGASKML